MDLVTPGIGLLFWMLLSFLIVLLILKKYAWKPILDMLKKREDSIEEALQAAEEAKKEMSRLKADNEKILNEARTERDSLLREAREVRDRILREAKEHASVEANKILQNAREEIGHQKNQAMNEIKIIVSGLSVEIAEKILCRELSDENRQKEYVDGLLDDIKLN